MKTQITKEIAQKMLESNEPSLKEFAILNFPELGKKKLPKSWEELGALKGWYVDSMTFLKQISCTLVKKSTRNLFSTRKQAEASIALAQLSQLREVYRDGWEPDWNDRQTKYGIEFVSNEISTYSFSGTANFLSFQSAEVRDEFLNNFTDLINQAKPLMS